MCGQEWFPVVVSDERIRVLVSGNETVVGSTPAASNWFDTSGMGGVEKVVGRSISKYFPLRVLTI